MSKSSQTEKLKKSTLTHERLKALSAQMLQEVVGGQAHIESATGGAGAGK